MNDKVYRILLFLAVFLGLASVVALTVVTALMYNNCSIITFISRCGG